MNSAQTLGLFQGTGIELEYMIVDQETLDIRPISDKVLQKIDGSSIKEFTQKDISWSNELVLHVMELKTTGPVVSLHDTVSLFQRDITVIHRILQEWNARLMPTGTHPWMDPTSETQIWPHSNREIYDTLNKIFDCKRHGWANLQSTQINLPFSNDEEFGRLHAAIRLVLPILPALSASSPVVDGKKQGLLNYRLEAYRHNSIKIPSVTGQVIPEPIFSIDGYKTHILKPLYDRIRPFDPNGTLQFEWINARGAIPRFDRYAIEIRIMDTQECPLHDLAFCWLIQNTAKALTEEKWVGYEEQKEWESHRLEKIFLDVIKDAEHAVLADPDYLRIFGLTGGGKIRTLDLWSHIYESLGLRSTAGRFSDPIRLFFNQGTLASRILKALQNDIRIESLKAVFKELCHCLEKNQSFIP